jgi:nucleoid DNA-binding protein
MPKSGTLTKAHIVEAVAEANGYTCNQSFEIVEILLERIKAALESGDDVLISNFENSASRKKMSDEAETRPPEKI